MAPYREYATATVCNARPDDQATLQGELMAMNALLADFLQATSAGPDGVWSDEQVDLLAEAEKSLAPALDAHDRTLGAVGRCGGFVRKQDFPELVRKGQELSRQARQRIAAAPELLPVLRAKAELRKWKEQQRQDQKTERASWCPPKPRGVPDVYFALEDETGRVEWMFCDGSSVVQERGEAPELVAREGRAVPRAVQAGYLRTAAKYPSSQIRRPPRAPPPAAGPETDSEKDKDKDKDPEAEAEAESKEDP